MNQLSMFASTPQRDTFARHREPMSPDALVSDCETYRYWLSRQWETGPWILWLMLNPSKADATETDPTLDKVTQYTKREGYCGLMIGNVYAYRSTDPKKLVQARKEGAVDVFGPERDEWIDRMLESASMVVCGWGANALPEHSASMLERIRKAGQTPLTLTFTKNGLPGHPLYLKNNLPLLEIPT